MITAVAFCPEAPALVPDVGRGLDRELGAVRAACRTAITRAAARTSRIVVLASGDATRPYPPTARGSFTAFGVSLTVPLGSDDPGPVELPSPLAVGGWLLRNALGPGNGAFGWSVGADSTGVRLPDEPTMLLVVGDGSARRSAKAPGYFDPRAEPRDAATAEALRSGDGERLHATDGDADLLVAGSRAWDAVARKAAGLRWDAELLYEGAPFGVGYFVALWTR